jgi:hypothetical protein
LVIALVTVVPLLLIFFREQVAATARSLMNNGGSQRLQQQSQQQMTVNTVYADLPLLEELPKANVLWINNTTSTDNKPEAWGISMFHSLHCLKMWKDSLNPATEMNAHVHGESEYAEHSLHCISYLVQVRKSNTRTNHSFHLGRLTVGGSWKC